MLLGQLVQVDADRCKVPGLNNCTFEVLTRVNLYLRAEPTMSIPAYMQDQFT